MSALLPQAAAAAPTAPTKGKKAAAAGPAADAAAALLQLQRDAMHSLHALYDALLSKPLLPSPHDLRAAEQLVRATALGCLLRPGQQGDRASKATEEALRRSCAGGWVGGARPQVSGLRLRRVGF